MNYNNNNNKVLRGEQFFSKLTYFEKNCYNLRNIR